MSRTNIEIDDALLERAQTLYRLRTKRETVELALKRLVGVADKSALLELEGIGWEGNLAELRDDRS